MRIEERKGKLELVLEKTIVDVNSPAFNIVKELREKWLGLTMVKMITVSRGL